MRIYIYLERVDLKIFLILSKKKEKIKKHKFSQNSSYLIIHWVLIRGNFMDVEKKWMLMTYYCPTHGDSGILRPIEMTKKEISQKFFKKGKTSKN